MLNPCLPALAMIGTSTVALAADDRYEIFVSGSSWAITPKAGQPPVQALDLARGFPKTALFKAYPDSLPSEVQANLACVPERNGKLRSCMVEQIQPDTAATRKLALKVARAHVASKSQIEERWGNIDAVKLSVRLVNKNGRPGPLACLPPYCRVTPAPPLPPAAPEKR